MPGPDRARRAWERHEKIGPPAAAACVVVNFRQLSSLFASVFAGPPLSRRTTIRAVRRASEHAQNYEGARHLRRRKSSLLFRRRRRRTHGAIGVLVLIAECYSHPAAAGAPSTRVPRVFWAALPTWQQSPERFFAWLHDTKPSSPSSSFLPTHYLLAYEWSVISKGQHVVKDRVMSPSA